jgi:hypothetical protein
VTLWRTEVIPYYKEMEQIEFKQLSVNQKVNKVAWINYFFGLLLFSKFKEAKKGTKIQKIFCRNQAPDRAWFLTIRT